MTRVMISYCDTGNQRDFASSLEQDLANAGLTTWIDFKDSANDSPWEKKIIRVISSSDYVVLCLSTEYFEQEKCLFECFVAHGYGKTILPIVIPNDSTINFVEHVSRFEETRGLGLINCLNFQSQSVLGLEQDETALKERLINAILKPSPTDIDYDVFCSFRTSQAMFATQVADDLNAAGIYTFIHSRGLDAGVDWRRVSWNANLRSKIHVVFLSPDFADSEFIRNEIWVSATKKDVIFLPIVVEEFAGDDKAQSAIRDALAHSTRVSILNDIEWMIPDEDYETFFRTLTSKIKEILSRSEE